ncbi:hypothetical protein EDD21DRAFT_369299 [Dissophora ornata]|nr:hypothetical protein EDD21DRAFT_369299 [Dissophora ornata]
MGQALDPDMGSLPSADVLFGSSSALDLFQPAQPMPQERPLQQSQRLEQVSKQPHRQPPSQLLAHSSLQQQRNLQDLEWRGEFKSVTEPVKLSPPIARSEESMEWARTSPGHSHISRVPVSNPRPAGASASLVGVVSTTSALGAEITHNTQQNPSNLAQMHGYAMSSLQETSGDIMANATTGSGSSFLTGDPADMDASQLFSNGFAMESSTFFTNLAERDPALLVDGSSSTQAVAGSSFAVKPDLSRNLGSFVEILGSDVISERTDVTHDVDAAESNANLEEPLDPPMSLPKSEILSNSHSLMPVTRLHDVSVPNTSDGIDTMRSSLMRSQHQCAPTQPVIPAEKETQIRHHPLKVESTAGGHGDVSQLLYLDPYCTSASFKESPFLLDENNSRSMNPTLDREETEQFSSLGIHGNASTEHSVGYSILELGAGHAQASYFPQTRQSPLIQEHYGMEAPLTVHSDPTERKLQQIEVEASTFDQVSLTEDVTVPPPQVVSTTLSPLQKERGLASLLDPSTLSAMEDLLNMPKSAAFERGMSRLFKGVKNSATSIFASPLSQSSLNPTPGVEGSVKHDQVGGDSASDDSKPCLSDSVVSESIQHFAEADESGHILLSSAEYHVTEARPLDSTPSMQAEPASSHPPLSDWTHKQPSLLPGVSDSTPEEFSGIASVAISSAMDSYGQCTSNEDAEEEVGPSKENSKSQRILQSCNGLDRTADSSRQAIQSDVNTSDPSTNSLQPEVRTQANNSKVGLLSPDNVSIRRPSSPSVLDGEALLRKHAAVSAFSAEQAGGASSRASTEKRVKLLEKARGLLEKRQQKYSGHSSLSAAQTEPVKHSFPASGPRSSFESPLDRTNRSSGRPSVDSDRMTLDLSGEQDSAHTTGTSTLTSNSTDSCYHAPAQSFGAAKLGGDSLQSLLEQNNQLRQQMGTLLAELSALKMERDLNTSLKSQQLQELQGELSGMDEESEMARLAPNSPCLAHSQQVHAILVENQGLQSGLTQHQHDAKDQNAQPHPAVRHQHHEMELVDGRLGGRESEATRTGLNQSNGVDAENEQPHQGPDRTQRQLVEQLSGPAHVIQPSNSELSAGHLSREVEGLRRQLKGQRAEMKQMQDTIRRSEAEKRDFVSKIQNLERLLANAEKHR